MMIGVESNLTYSFGKKPSCQEQLASVLMQPHTIIYVTKSWNAKKFQNNVSFTSRKKMNMKFQK